MAGQLTCNFPTCGKVISDITWITSCSHVFCVDHGELEFNSKRANKCPLCLADLFNQLDVVKADINPSEQYKSMILAGQRPEVVMEMAWRALALWHYQTQLQFAHEKQEKVVAEKKARETVSKISQEKSSLEMDLNNLRKDMDELQKKKNDVENVLDEKTRLVHKLTAQLDALRCRLSEQDARQQRDFQAERSATAATNASRLGFLNTNPSIRPPPPRQPFQARGSRPMPAWSSPSGRCIGTEQDNSHNNNTGSGNFPGWIGGGTSNVQRHPNDGDPIKSDPAPGFVLNF